MNNKKEYMVHVWGGAWNEDANPSIEKDLGIKEGYHYFDTEEEKNIFCKKLDNPIYSNQGIVKDVMYGIMTHKKTIFVATFKYKDKEFIIHHDFGYEYPADVAEFSFTEGNMSCDCSISSAIKREYGIDAIPELDCGDEIELVDYHIEYSE